MAWMPASADGNGLATSFGAMVGTLGTVLFYGTATMNLIWQHIGGKRLKKENLRNYIWLTWDCLGSPILSVPFYQPSLSVWQVPGMVDTIKAVLPMDGLAMKTIFTVGSLLPCVGIATC